MIRFILALIFLTSLPLFAKTNIDEKITSTSKKLSTFDKKYSSLHTKTAKNAKAILKEKQVILKQQKHLQKLRNELGVKEKDFQLNKNKLKQLESSQMALDKEQKQIESKLVSALAHNISLSMLIDDERVINTDALITEELLKKLMKKSKDDLNDLNNKFTDNSDRLATLHTRVNALKDGIDEIENKRKDLIKTQRSNKKALKQLEANKKNYKKSINKLLSQQDALQKTLTKLNIIKTDKIKQEQERARAAAAKAQRNKAITSSKNLPRVKKVGSSYQKIKTKRYRGRKTIAPLDSYKVVKKFGPYTDPIYDLRIFNESVSLQPRERNAKVKNILNGKVILAQNTALLNNVVIIEHSDGIHTIYAHLDKIAPTIKKGQKIKKGSIIGRVNDELMFEVTQKNYHINPMQLIR